MVNVHKLACYSVFLCVQPLLIPASKTASAEKRGELSLRGLRPVTLTLILFPLYSSEMTDIPPCLTKDEIFCLE